jgi:hypothetical protein
VEKLLNEELNDLIAYYCAGDKVEKMRWLGHVARMRRGIGVYTGFLGKPEGKSPLGRRR